MFPLGTARCSKVVANLCNTNKTPPRLRGQRSLRVAPLKVGELFRVAPL